MVKAVLLDFDGTVVTRDIMTLLAEAAGKGTESDHRNAEFHAGRSKGLTGLIARINLLTGMKLSQIEALLKENPYLMPGARELTKYLRDTGIITILASGSILSVLKQYQRILPIDYLVGSHVRIRKGILDGISAADYPDTDFKLFEVKKILEALDIPAADTVAIGDSPGDKSLFRFAHKSIAINPKGGIEELADYTIHDDLAKAIPILEELNQ